MTKNCDEMVKQRELEIFILPLPARRGAKYVKQFYTDEVRAKLMRFLEEK